MSGAADVPRYPLRLAGGQKVLEDFLATASAEDEYLVTEVLMSLVEGTWRDRYQWYDDVTSRVRVYIEVRRGLLMAVRFTLEYPNYFSIDWIEPP